MIRDAGMFEPPADSSCGDVRTGEEEQECESRCSVSEESSSIGKNSDLSATEDDGENEVQSSYKGSLDSMDALEEVLPIRRGISSFYSGKSKSFTSLADLSSSSMKDLGKPENAYSRRRRNMVAFNHGWERSKGFGTVGGGISKRPLMSASKSQLALAAAMSSSESLSSSSEESPSVRSSPCHLPPIYPRSRAPHHHLASRWPQQHGGANRRSLSVADLQQCKAAAAVPYYDNF